LMSQYIYYYISTYRLKMEDASRKERY